MNDFRYLQTLENLASRIEQPDNEAARQAVASAREFLAKVAGAIAIDQREQPAGIDLDAVRREAADRIMALRPMLPAPAPVRSPAPRPAPRPGRGKLPPFPGL